jgi:hypothetical protein
MMIALTALYPSSTRAQVTNATGTIQGTVTDSSGSAVPGAKVTLTQPSTGSSKVITATGSGYYSAGSLVPGQYTVTVEAGGFAKTSEDLTVRVGVSTNGDVKLGIGAASIMVEVQASAIQVDTQQTQIAGVLNQEQIANLPVNGRNFLDLAQLQPGVQIQDGTSIRRRMVSNPSHLAAALAELLALSSMVSIFPTRTSEPRHRISPKPPSRSSR